MAVDIPAMSGARIARHLSGNADSRSMEGEVMVQVIGIEHVQLAMPRGEEESARHFYADLLGIPEVPKPPHLAVRGGCWFERSALKLHLGVEDPFFPAKKAHPALVVSGLRVLVDRLKAAGAAIVEDPLDGFDRVYTADPFGNRIELMEPTN